MPRITDSEVLKNARTFNAGRRWNRPGLLKADDPNLVNSPLVQEAIEGMTAATGRSREEAEDALVRAHNLGELLTPEEVAVRLKVEPKWVYEKQRKRCKNPIPSVPMGRYIRYDWDAVVKWLEEQARARATMKAAPRRKKAS